MTAPEILAVAATTAGVLMAIAPFLQIRRILRTRSSRDVSLLYLCALDAGFVVWVSYGWSIGNPALIISNTASLTFMSMTILVAVAFRRGRGGEEVPAREPVPGIAEPDEPVAQRR